MYHCGIVRYVWSVILTRRSSADVGIAMLFAKKFCVSDSAQINVQMQ